MTKKQNKGLHLAALYTLLYIITGVLFGFLIQAFID